MQTETHTQQDVGQALQQAVLQAAVDSALADTENGGASANASDSQKRAGNEKKGAVSPLTGAPTPGGRPKGVRNKLTNLRDAVLEAFDTVGGPAYLVQLAQGTQSDRAAFVSLVSKVLPTQVQAQVEGGVQIHLSWLGQRQIGTTVAQSAEQVTQVVEMQRDSRGTYQIIDPASQHSPAQSAENADPLPPIEPGVGPG